MFYADHMERRYQVFISSTFIDLVEERREIIQALLEMDCLPAGMEMFPAANDDKWTLIKGVIDQSDYYLVVLGERYGSTADGGISYTEMEYDYAVSQAIPVMGFVHGDPDSIPKAKLDLDPLLQERLAAFQTKVQKRMIKRWTTPAELGSVVTRGMIPLIKNNKRDGWVRGNHAMTEETRTQIAELQAQIAKSERDAISRKAAPSVSINREYEHGTDQVELDYQATITWETKQNEYTSGSAKVTWDFIVKRLGPIMMGEVSEKDLRRKLDRVVVPWIRRIERYHDAESVTPLVYDDSWSNVIIQLRALNIIEISNRRHPIQDKATYWVLTKAGDDYLVGLRATRRRLAGGGGSEEEEEEE